jgi:hypothetical protein
MKKYLPKLTQLCGNYFVTSIERTIMMRFLCPVCVPKFKMPVIELKEHFRAVDPQFLVIQLFSKKIVGVQF